MTGRLLYDLLFVFYNIDSTYYDYSYYLYWPHCCSISSGDNILECLGYICMFCSALWGFVGGAGADGSLFWEFESELLLGLLLFVYWAVKLYMILVRRVMIARKRANTA